MSFKAAFAAASAKALADADKKFKATCLDLFSRIVTKTPVDKGTARANWVVSVTNPDYEIQRKEDASKLIDAAQVVEEGLAVIRDCGLGKTVYLNNNLPYILRLENEGHSGQAPAGMVVPSMQELGLK